MLMVLRHNVFVQDTVIKQLQIYAVQDYCHRAYNFHTNPEGERFHMNMLHRL